MAENLTSQSPEALTFKWTDLKVTVHPGLPIQFDGRRGTDRAGGDVRVFPDGLASRRSSAVKATTTSLASKARLRRPTFIWVSISASRSRSIASLVA